MDLQERNVSCPYCGEAIDLLIDTSEGSQTYIEDCQVCCRPINISLSVGQDGDASVAVRDENE